PTAGYTSAAEQTITVKQKAHTITEFGNNTYYQWGRKDPFVGILEGEQHKTWYDADGNKQINQKAPVAAFSGGNNLIASGIQKPTTFIVPYGIESVYFNLWSADNNLNTANDNIVVKTVYDPCPVGYKLPTTNGFTGFSTTGTDTNNSSEFNVSGSFNKGWNFYCGKNKSGDTVFFPASGYLYFWGGSPMCVGIEGYYWSPAPHFNYCARHCGFASNMVYPLYVNNNTGFGFGVWPFQE
ncbi:MAG: fimbrillin family protein, partial [Bacteroides heparinolyticus]